jgi:hypothetical protein
MKPPAPARGRPPGPGKPPQTALQQVFGLPDRMLADRVFKHLAYEPPADVLSAIPTKALLACTARSGSSIMSAALVRYGLNFQEFVNPEGYVAPAARGRPGFTVNDFARHLRDHAVRNGVLAIKFAPTVLLYLAAMGETPDRLADWRIVFLRRRNLVRQAISAFIAETTGSWTSRMAATAPISEADYSFERILALVDLYSGNNEHWERLFGLFGLEPLRVVYEDYVAALDDGTEQIARFIGVDSDAFPNARTQTPVLESQTTELNGVWERRFRAELLTKAQGAVAKAVAAS